MSSAHLKVKVKVKSLSHVRLFATPWTVAYQAPLSMGFSRQEYWSGLPFPSPGDLPDPGIESRSPTLQADALTSEPPGKPSNEEVKVKSFSRVQLFVTPWTAAYQAPPSMGFSRQEYWSGVPSPSPFKRQCSTITLRPDLKPQTTWVQISDVSLCEHFFKPIWGNSYSGQCALAHIHILVP